MSVVPGLSSYLSIDYLDHVHHYARPRPTLPLRTYANVMLHHLCIQLPLRTFGRAKSLPRVLAAVDRERGQSSCQRLLNTG